MTAFEDDSPFIASETSDTSMLEENWGASGVHNGVNSSNPPAFLPKQVLQLFANNPTLLSAIVQDAGGKHTFDPFAAGFNSDQMERLSAALSLYRHNGYSETARDTSCVQCGN